MQKIVVHDQYRTNHTNNAYYSKIPNVLTDS